MANRAGEQLTPSQLAAKAVVVIKTKPDDPAAMVALKVAADATPDTVEDLDQLLGALLELDPEGWPDA